MHVTNSLIETTDDLKCIVNTACQLENIIMDLLNFSGFAPVAPSFVKDKVDRPLNITLQGSVLKISLNPTFFMIL